MDAATPTYPSLKGEAVAAFTTLGVAHNSARRRAFEGRADHSRIVSLDFETCNCADLRKVGADVYSRDPSLVVTVLAWAFDDDPVRSVTRPKTLPREVEAHLRADGKFRAWSAAFEWAILVNH